MPTPSAPTVTRDTTPRPAPTLGQIRALAGAEWRLLLRNTVAVVNVFCLPVLAAVFFAHVVPGPGLRVTLPVVVTGTALLFVVYYTLVTALVARRESLLLKRLRTGEASDGVILAGVAVPFALVTFAEAMVATIASVGFFGAPLHPRLLAFVAGVALACVTWTLLAVASTGITRSVEHAQITTLPLIFGALLLSGLSIPLALMPAPLHAVAQLMPLTPIVELASVAFAGTDGTGQALTGVDLAVGMVRPLLVLVVWALLARWVARRTMRWEARS